MSTPTMTPPRTPAPPHKRSVMPYVFLAIAIVSVLASLLMWKHQHDNPQTHGTRVIAGSQPSAASGDLAITALQAPEIWHCSAGSDNTVVLSWAATGATGVDITMDGSSKPLFTNQGPQSQASVPAPCAPDAHTYHVIAKSADGKSVSKSATTKGV